MAIETTDGRVVEERLQPRDSFVGHGVDTPWDTDNELVDLTVAVIAINAWNRLAVTFRPAVGNYKPAAAAIATSA